MPTIISKKELIEAGYPASTAQGIIRQAKIMLVHRGYPLYNNRRLGRVPKNIVEEIIGTELTDSMPVTSK